jgi:RNA polymerase sigma-70 factor (ECF subfamily)
VAILARPGLVSHLAVARGGQAHAHEDDAGVGAVARARLDVLYAAHGARIHRFLSDLLGDAALAADGTQETFVRAYQKLPDLAPRHPRTVLGGLLGRAPSVSAESAEWARGLLPWLFAIARNVSLELRKARSRAVRRLAPAHEGLDAPGPGTPESDCLGREALRVVEAALERLPEERRAMLLLRLDHGLSYDDIAVTMGCSVAKVKIEIFRAREVLRATMDAYEGVSKGRRAR